MRASFVTVPGSDGNGRSGRQDPENPVWTDEQLLRGRRARELRKMRLSLDLCIEEFAERYGFDREDVTAWERGRQNIGEAEYERITRIQEELDEQRDHRSGWSP